MSIIPRRHPLAALAGAFAALSLFVALLPHPSAAQVGPGGFSHIGGFDHIQTDDIQYNLNSGEFQLKDRFTAIREGTDITADSGSGNTKKKLLHAKGHVIVHQTKPIKGNGDASTVTEEPSTLTCDRLDGDGVRKVYQANGDVHFLQADRDATADAGTLDDNTNILHLEGHVHIRDKEQFLDGDSVDYNTVTGELHARGAPVSIRVPAVTPGPATPAPARTPRKR